MAQAITTANGSPGSIIDFDIGSGGAKTISPDKTHPLPTITAAVTIDGTSQPGYAGVPLIRLNGTNDGTANGLTIEASNCTIKGLIIDNFGGSGIDLEGSVVAGTNHNMTGEVIQGNYIGTNAAGTAALANSGYGIEVLDGTSSSTIGGSSSINFSTGDLSGAGNLISGNTLGGIYFDGSNGSSYTQVQSNYVEGNYIGTDVTGKAAIRNDPSGNNYDNIDLLDSSTSNTIGGPSSVDAHGNLSGYGNLISASGEDGIFVSDYNVAGNVANSNIIEGNFIGTDVTGTQTLGNLGNGVHIGGGAVYTTVGGTGGASTRNIISGSTGTSNETGYIGGGVVISDSLGDGTASGNTVEGNYIGTDVTGTVAIANADSGVVIQNGPTNNFIGGTSTSARNIISGNTLYGVDIDTNVSGNVVEGNYIGTDYTGESAIANANGVRIRNTANNTIGGTISGAGNVISGNTSFGVIVYGTSATSDLIAGNIIGLDHLGATALSNGFSGICIGSGITFGDTSYGIATNITIGGTTTVAYNVIAANNNGHNFDPVPTGGGIYLTGSTTSDSIEGNILSYNAADTSQILNTGFDIEIDSGSTANLNGGTVTAARSIYGGGTVTLSGGTLSGGTISGSVRYANGTTIAATVLKLSSSGGTLTNVTLNGTLDMEGYSFSLATLGGIGTVQNSSTLATLTFTGSGNFAGSITGSTTAVVIGGSSQDTTLSGANSNTGGYTINSTDTLTMGSTTGLTSSANVTVNGTLDLFANNITIGLLFGTGIVTNSLSTLATLTIATSGGFSGVLTANLALTMSGTSSFFLNQSSTYTGNTTLTSGTLLVEAPSGVFGSGSLLLNGGTLQVVTAATITNPYTIGGSSTLAGSAPVTLSGLGTIGSTWTDTEVNTVTLSNNLSGSGGVIVAAGTGNLVLSGASDTWNGALTMSSGVLNLNTPITDSSVLTLNGGTLLANQAATFSGVFSVSGAPMVSSTSSLTMSGNGTINSSSILVCTGSGTTTLAGSIGGAGGLTENAIGGTLTLSAPDSYQGVTTITNGTMKAGAAGALSSSSAFTLANTAGAVLNLNNFNNTVGSLAGGGTSGGNVNLGSGVLTTGSATASTTYSGIISGSGNLIKQGVSTFTLAGANTYTGTTSIIGGFLSISADNNLGTAPATATAGQLTINAGALQATTTFTLNSNRGIAIGPTSTSGVGDIDVTGSNTLSYGGVIANNGGQGSLAVVDSGTLVLSGANTYTGFTIIIGATLAVSADNNFGATPSTVFNGEIQIEGGILEATASFILNSKRGMFVGTGAANTNGIIDVTGSNNLTYGGIIGNNGTGAATLALEDTGTLTLTGTSSTFTGGVGINTGSTLSINNDGSLGTVPSSATAGLIDFFGGTLQVTSTMTLNSKRGIGIYGSGTIDVTGSNTLTYGGIAADLIVGPGSLTKTDTGTLIFSGADTYSQGTTINGGQLTVSGSIKGPVTVNSAGTLAGTGAIDQIQALTTSYPSGSGTFNIKFNGATTSSLMTGSTAAQVQTALSALSTIGGIGGTVAVSIKSQNSTSTVYNVTFDGALAGLNNAVMSGTGSSGVTVSSVISQAGVPTITGNVTNNGTVLAGASGQAGSFAIAGTYTQSSTGNLLIYVGGVTPGTQFSHLNVSGNASLAGNVTVSIINSFVPTYPETFAYLTAASISGVFSNAYGIYPNFTMVFNPTNVTLTALNDVVTNTLDSGVGSLRQAIIDANNAPAQFNILFNIPTMDAHYNSSTGVYTISPASALPTIANTITINATTEPGYSTRPIVELNGASAGSSVNGLAIKSSNSVVEGLEIDSFTADAINISGPNTSGVLIQANYLGTNYTGLSAAADGGNGVTINNASNCIINNNVLSGNTGSGVLVTGSGATGNTIEGNEIGTTWNGMGALGNVYTGIEFSFGAANNILGGVTTGARNIISANGYYDVDYYGSGVTGNIAEGNYIGTYANGTSGPSLSTAGVLIWNTASNNTIGGTAAGAGNIIGGINNGSGSSYGVWLYGAGTGGNTIAGNFIGSTLANEDGIFVTGNATGNTLGGPTAASRNIISGNTNDGIHVGSGGSAIVIEEDYFGTDSTGSISIPNSNHAIELDTGSIIEVNQGSLLVNGSISVTGILTVAPAATIVVNGGLTVQSGGVLSTSGSSTATNDVQTVTVNASSGTFTLTLNGQTTTALAYNAAPSVVQAALNALSSIGGVGGSVAVSYSSSVYTITFGAALAGDTIEALSGTASAGSLSIATTQFGSNAAIVGNVSDIGILTLGGYATSIGALTGSGLVTSSAASTLTVNVGGTFSGSITGTTTSLTVSGATQTVALSGNNTYGGTTTINSGNTLQAGSVTAFSASSNLTDNGTLDLHGFNNTVGALNGNGVVTNGNSTGATITVAGSGTFFGVIQDGAGTVAFNSASSSGAVYLIDTNSYSGGTTVPLGALISYVPGALGTGTVTVGGGDVELYASAGASTYSNNFVIGANTTSAIGFAVNGSTPNLITLGTLALGTGATLEIVSFLPTPTNQAYNFSFGTTYLPTSSTIDVNDNGTGVGNVTLGALNDGGNAATLNVEGPGALTLTTAATSLVSGTAVNLTGNATLNVNQAAALGTVANVSLATATTLNLNVGAALNSITNSGGIVAAGSPVSVNNITFGGGTLNGSGTLTVSGTLNWTGGTMAGSGKVVVGSSATMNIGGTVALDQELDNQGNATWTSGTLNMANGTLVNSGSFTGNSSSSLNMTGTAGTNTFSNTGTFTDQGTGTTQLTDVFFTNSGTLNVNAGTLSLEGGFTNFAGTTLTGGIYDVKATLQFSSANVQTNAATITLDGSSAKIVDQTGANAMTSLSANSTAASLTLLDGAQLTTSSAFTNQGSVTVDATGGSTVFNANGGYTQAGGTTTLSASNSGTTVLNAANSLAVSGGTLTANTALSINTFTFSGGTLAGSGTVTIGGALTWTGGTMSGTGKAVVASTATLSINPGGGFVQLNQELDNQGAATWSSGEIRMFNGTINNSGSFTADTSSGVLSAYGYPSPGGTANAFNNSGTMTVVGSSTVQFIYLPPYVGVSFNNSGTVNVNAGTLSLLAGGTHSGSFAVASGATLWLESDHTFRSTATITGNGNLGVFFGTTTYGGSITTTGSVTIHGANFTVGGTLSASLLDLELGTITVNGTTSIGTLTFSGGTLACPGTVTVSSALTWTGGEMGGTGKVVVGSSATMNINGTVLLNQELDNQGAATWTSGTLYVLNATLVNSGSFTANSASALILAGEGGPNTFSNIGTFTDQGTGTAQFTSVSFTNSGTLNVNAGELSLEGGFSNLSGTTLTGGSYDLKGILQITGANIQTNAAILTLDGPSAAIVDQSGNNGLANFNTNANTGFLTLLDGSQLTTSGTLTNQGSITVDATGVSTSLNIGGTYTQASGTTTLVAGGTLAASPTVTLQGGTLFGTGTISGNLSNGAIVEPGTSVAPGEITITGTYTQTSSGTLNEKVGGNTGPGTNYDHLAIDGAATLGGTLNATLINGFVPQAHDQYQLLRFASSAGVFSVKNFFSVATGLVLNEQSNESNLSLVVVGPPPTSHVGTLAAKQVSDTFTIPVTLTDPSNDTITSVDLYVSVDNTPFVRSQTQTIGTFSSSINFTFSAQDRNTYAFYSIINEASGPVESKTNIEATTFVPDLNPPVTHVLAASPSYSWSPFNASSFSGLTPSSYSNGVFTLNWAGADPDQNSGSPSGKIVTVEVFAKVDSGAGQLIATQSAGSPNGNGVYTGTTTYNALADGQAHTYSFFSIGIDDQSVTQAAANPDASFSNITYSAPLIATLTVEKGIAERRMCATLMSFSISPGPMPPCKVWLPAWLARSWVPMSSCCGTAKIFRRAAHPKAASL